MKVKAVTDYLYEPNKEDIDRVSKLVDSMLERDGSYHEKCQVGKLNLETRKTQMVWGHLAELCVFDYLRETGRRVTSKPDSTLWDNRWSDPSSKDLLAIVDGHEMRISIKTVVSGPGNYTRVPAVEDTLLTPQFTRRKQYNEYSWLIQKHEVHKGDADLYILCIQEGGEIDICWEVEPEEDLIRYLNLSQYKSNCYALWDDLLVSINQNRSRE